MARVVHFEIHADDVVRAKSFYESIFPSWKVEEWEDQEEYHLITTGDDARPGINGGLMKRKAPITSESIVAYVCTIDVTDEKIDEVLMRVESSGGRLIVPKTAVPKVGYLAYCKDTESNIFGLMEADETAV